MLSVSTSSANKGTTTITTPAPSPQPPPDLIGSLMLSSSGILDALLPSSAHTATGALAPSSSAQSRQFRSGYANSFLPTDFYRPLSGTLPRRRYSFGGLPDFGEQQISNLLNETSRSISRSMQILCDNRENLDLCEIKKALDIDPRPELLDNVQCAMGGVNPDQSNLLALGTNFYSHPNIYTPPGGIYGSGQLKYQSPSAAAALFGPSPLSPSAPLHCQFGTGSGPLLTSSNAATNVFPSGFDLLSSPSTMGAGRRYKSNVNYLASKGISNYAYPPPLLPQTGNTSTYYNPPSNYPWNGTAMGNPLSLNQRLMAGLDCAHPTNLRNSHYGSHPIISKYGTVGRNANFPSNYNNYSPSSNLTSSAINSATSGYPAPSFVHEAALPSMALGSAGYNGYGNYPPSTGSYHQQPQLLPYRHGPFGSYQYAQRGLPMSYCPAYKMVGGVGSCGGFYNATRHGGGAFNANNLSRSGGGGSASAGDMKRQVSFKFDVDQLSIGS